MAKQNIDISEEIKKKLPKNFKTRQTKKCRQCGKTFYSKLTASKYTCGEICSRKYFSERFDRWVASPEKLSLPQNYDEFLTKEKINCLVEGCSFVGHHLSMHMNRYHGVQETDFKKLAGFNLSSGITSLTLKERSKKQSNAGKFTVAIKKYYAAKKRLEKKINPWRKSGISETEIDNNKTKFLSDAAKKISADTGVSAKVLSAAVSSFLDGARRKAKRDYISLEKKEHLVKANALNSLQRGDRKCLYCSKGFFGISRQIFCSVLCQRRYHFVKMRKQQGYSGKPREQSLTCSHCGLSFVGIKRKSTATSACCSKRCSDAFGSLRRRNKIKATKQ
jgi:hypothetical protein